MLLLVEGIKVFEALKQKHAMHHGKTQTMLLFCSLVTAERWTNSMHVCMPSPLAATDEWQPTTRLAAIHTWNNTLPLSSSARMQPKDQMSIFWS